MTARDGDGWAGCGQGHRHWGRFGAAGLLLSAPGAASGRLVLLQRRRRWANHGATWGPPGGARDSHESAAEAALRESAEECGLPPRAVSVHGIRTDDHGGWAYCTVLGTAASELAVSPAAAEISAARWFPAAEVAGLDLHPGFARCWPVLSRALDPVTIIVDGANVMGSRPDGWWRDRAAAARRLREQLAALAGAGMSSLPQALELPALDRWYPTFVLVVEGQARVVAGDGPADQAPAAAGQPGGPAVIAGQLQVAAAAGSGDDLIAGLAADTAGRRLVVTADRELGARCATAGAPVSGPGWLLAQL